MPDCSIDTISQEKMTVLRQGASYAFSNKGFDEDFYQTLIAQIQQTASQFSDLDISLLKKQLALANQAYLQGGVKGEIQIQHPLLQFVWGATLMRIAAQPEIMETWPENHQSENGLINSKIWEQLKQNDVMQTEMAGVATSLASRGFVYDRMKIRWGGTHYPDVGYYFNREEGLVNMDLLWALNIGLEHARSCVMHELAHSCGTREWTPQFNQLYARSEELEKRSDLSKEEQEELQKIQFELQYLHYVFDEAENSFASGFGCLLTDEKLYPQDLRYDVCAVEFQNFLPLQQKDVKEFSPDLQKLVQKTADKVQKERMQGMGNRMKELLWRFINMKLVLREAFYCNNGLFENTVENWKRVGVHVDWLEGVDKNNRPVKERDVLNEFLAACAALQSQQIPLDIHSSRSYIVNEIKKANESRNAVTDDIYNRFFKNIVESMYKEAQKNNQIQQVKNQMEQQQKSMQSSQHQKQQNQIQKRTDQNGANGSGQDGEDKKAGSSQNGQGKQNGSGQNGEDKKAGNSQNGQDNQNGRDQNEPGQNVSVSNQTNGKEVSDTDKGKDIQTIIFSSSQNGSHDSSANSEIDYNQWQPTRLSDFEAPVFKKDNNAYNAIIAKYPHKLQKLKSLFLQLRNEYLDEQHNSQAELLPESSLNDALNIQSVQNRIIKTATRQHIDIEDFKHYDNPTAPSIKKAPIDICICIDVSGSVEGAGYSKLAVEIGCLLNEAVRKNDYFNVYLGIMTDPACFLAEPGMTDKDIAGNLGALYNGRNWDSVGDEIYDITVKTLDKIVKRQKRKEKEGSVHFFYISDGGHNDEEISRPALNTLMDSSFLTTFNWISFPTQWDNNCLYHLSQDRDRRKGPQGITNVVCSSGEDILPAIEKILKQRIREMKRYPSLDTKNKNRILTSALKETRRKVNE